MEEPCLPQCTPQPGARQRSSTEQGRLTLTPRRHAAPLSARPYPSQSLRATLEAQCDSAAAAAAAAEADVLRAVAERDEARAELARAVEREREQQAAAAAGRQGSGGAATPTRGTPKKEGGGALSVRALIAVVYFVHISPSNSPLHSCTHMIYPSTHPSTMYPPIYPG